jgi:hypothetical protein
MENPQSEIEKHTAAVIELIKDADEYIVISTKGAETTVSAQTKPTGALKGLFATIMVIMKTTAEQATEGTVKIVDKSRPN